MSQKEKLITMFNHKQVIDRQTANESGIQNFRQQVYFLRKDGYRIINCGKQTYKLVP